MGARPRQLSPPARAVVFVVCGTALFAPSVSAAEVRFEVSGELRRSAGALELLLRVRNGGDANARALVIEGRLGEERAEATLEALKAGATEALTLRFATERPRPGRHAVPLRIEYRPEQPADAAARRDPVLLLLDFGDPVPPALLIRVEPATLDVTATAELSLESVDAAAHRVRVTVLAPAGINVLAAPADVDVPARGRVSVPFRLIRGDAARARRYTLLVAASPIGEPIERAASAVGSVEIAPDPAWLPRLRPALWLLGVLLLLAALALEWRAPPPPG